MAVGSEYIDATRIGGWMRYVNHSCDPNCAVEKWNVGGEERCAVFSVRVINVHEELTFDYRMTLEEVMLKMERDASVNTLRWPFLAGSTT